MRQIGSIQLARSFREELQNLEPSDIERFPYKPLNPPPQPSSPPMASRLLARNLAQGLRGRAGLSLPMKRGLATPVSPPVKTETTTLKNGLTVSLHDGPGWTR